MLFLLPTECISVEEGRDIHLPQQGLRFIEDLWTEHRLLLRQLSLRVVSIESLNVVLAGAGLADLHDPGSRLRLLPLCVVIIAVDLKSKFLYFLGLGQQGVFLVFPQVQSRVAIFISMLCLGGEMSSEAVSASAGTELSSFMVESCSFLVDLEGVVECGGVFPGVYCREGAIVVM